MSDSLNKDLYVPDRTYQLPLPLCVKTVKINITKSKLGKVCTNSKDK